MTIQLFSVVVTALALLEALSLVYTLKKIEDLDKKLRSQHERSELIDKKLGVVIESMCQALGNVDRTQEYHQQAIFELMEHVNMKRPEEIDE